MDGEDERYVDEFGRPLPRWRPLEPEKRHRHKSFGSAAKAALDSLLEQRHPFVEALADAWPTLFPGFPASPGRYEDGMVFLYVPNAATLFSVRPRLAAVRRRLLAMPGAPKRINLRLEIHGVAKSVAARDRRRSVSSNPQHGVTAT